MTHMDTCGTFRGGVSPISVQPSALWLAMRDDAGLSPLEWQIVALARRDSAASLRPAGPLARALSMLFGRKTSTSLANPRLEALRRVATLSLRYGRAIDPVEVNAFLSAGFSAEKYEHIAQHVCAIQAARGTRRKSQ